MVADAPFGGTTGEVVLDPVPGEDPDAAVVHPDWEVDRQFAPDLAQNLPQALVEPEDAGGLIELVLRGGVGVGRGHRGSRRQDTFSHRPPPADISIGLALGQVGLAVG